MRLKKHSAAEIQTRDAFVISAATFGGVWFVLLASMIKHVIVYESGNCVKSERIMSENSVSADASVLNQPVNGFFTI
jgi:hypothetical protein